MDSTITNLSTTHHQSPSVSCGSSPQQNQQYAGDQQTYVLSQLRHTPPYMVTPPMLQSTPVQGPYMPQPVLTDMDIHRIINSLRISLCEEIQGMVQAVVQEQVQPLRHEITDLRQSVSILSNKVAFLEHELDNTNQYSRRHCVLVSNVPETPDEDTNQIICDIAKQGGANIKESDIDRSHRNGPPKRKDGKRRDIIVKFTHYKAKSDCIKCRKQLRVNKSNIFLNEQLTPMRRAIAFHCRALKKNHHSPITDTWTFDGNIYIKLNNQPQSVKISSLQELTEFGYRPN